MAMRITAVDIFCGAGGLTAGLEAAGVDVRAGFDLDARCAWPYERNTRATFVREDVERCDAEEVRRWLRGGDVRLLAGCAPCQPFSTYGRTRRKADDRWKLLKSFARLVREVRPELLTMENVPGLERQPVFKEFTATLEDLNYEVAHAIVECTDFGVPQRRRRLVLLASRVGPVQMPAPSVRREATVREAIGHLPPLAAGEVHPEDRLHAAAGMSTLNLERIRASKPGGSWRDWPEHLVAPCHRRRSGCTYVSVYGRMSWDEPSPTITTQCYGFGNGRFGHPEQDRAISLREAALLQSFPEWWQFFPRGERVNFKACGTAIGNAVPPKLGEAIGRQLIKAAKEAVHAA